MWAGSLKDYPKWLSIYPQCRRDACIPTYWTIGIDSRPGTLRQNPNLSQLLTKCRFQESEAVVADLRGPDPTGATIPEIMYI